MAGPARVADWFQLTVAAPFAADATTLVGAAGIPVGLKARVRDWVADCELAPRSVSRTLKLVSPVSADAGPVRCPSGVRLNPGGSEPELRLHETGPVAFSACS